MAQKKRRPGMALAAAAAVFGALVLSACASSDYTALNEPPKPDNRSAVVYFYGNSTTKAAVWDSDTPVGTFKGGPRSAVGCIPWKTTAGSHTFRAHSSNTVESKINLQANKNYYFEVRNVPSPPYTTLIIMREMNQEEEQTYRKWHKIKLMSFSDGWRTDFKSKNAPPK